MELRRPVTATPVPAVHYAPEMPVRAAELRQTFEEGLRQWMLVRTKHKQTVDALSAVLHAPFTYLEDRFVALVRAAEAFHATEFGAAAGATAEQEGRLARVKEAASNLDADDKAWLDSLLDASLAPVARHRVLALLRDLGDVGERLAGGMAEKFAATVTQTRNLITHPHSRPGKDALIDSEARYWHCEACSGSCEAFS